MAWTAAVVQVQSLALGTPACCRCGQKNRKKIQMDISHFPNYKEKGEKMASQSMERALLDYLAQGSKMGFTAQIYII